MLRNKGKKRTLKKDRNENGKLKISKMSKQVEVNTSMIENNSSKKKNSFENEEIPSLLEENNQNREGNNPMIGENENGKVKISKMSKQVDNNFLPEENSSMIEDNSSVEKKSLINEEIPLLLDENNQNMEENNSIIEENTKGQLISECLLGVIDFPKKTTKNLTNFCPRI